MKSRGKVLIVDNDPIVLSVTRARLESAGYEVVTRKKAPGTSRAILEQEPDVVLLDMMMPELSGAQIVEFLKKYYESICDMIILHSSLDPEILDEKVRETGVLGMIPKTEDDVLFLKKFETLFLLAQNRRSRSTEPRE
jgi:CheY-like chemotaxis protein